MNRLPLPPWFRQSGRWKPLHPWRIGDVPCFADGEVEAETWQGVRWPDWHNREERVFDEFAQAAGY